jgi:hypothetical protein
MCLLPASAKLNKNVLLLPNSCFSCKTHNNKQQVVETFVRLLESGNATNKSYMYKKISIFRFPLFSHFLSMENSIVQNFTVFICQRMGFQMGPKQIFKTRNSPFPKSQPNHLKELYSTTVVKEKQKKVLKGLWEGDSLGHLISFPPFSLPQQIHPTHLLFALFRICPILTAKSYMEQA